MLAISSGLISIGVLSASLRRLGDAFSKFLQASADARVEDHVADLKHDAAEDLPIDAAGQIDLLAGLAPDLLANLFHHRGSKSTALVTVTSIRWFSRFHSSSNRRRMWKISGIRCFSISSSRKLTNSGSAPLTARLNPSSFSAEEK